jgi:hypothetical protein
MARGKIELAAQRPCRAVAVPRWVGHAIIPWSPSVSRSSSYPSLLATCTPTHTQATEQQHSWLGLGAAVQTRAGPAAEMKLASSKRSRKTVPLPRLLLLAAAAPTAPMITAS